MPEIKKGDYCLVVDGRHRRTDTVRVMAVAERYAMVRHKGAYPFVVPLEHLQVVTDA